MNSSNFFEDVYSVVRLIPKGRVSSYGSIAAYLGSRSSARMVGWAMNAAHTLEDVPAHRVVNRQGALTGKHHFGSPDRMQKLLEAEGITVLEDRIVDFNKYFWNPAEEIQLDLNPTKNSL